MHFALHSVNRVIAHNGVFILCIRFMWVLFMFEAKVFIHLMHLRIFLL